MRNISLLLLLFIGTLSISAQSIIGTWVGKLELPNGFKLNIIFHFDMHENNYTGILDSPDQGAKGIPVDTIRFIDNGLYLKINKLMMVYKAELENDTIMRGSIIQGTLPIGLDLIKREYKLNRPQEPLKPYPYISEDIVFHNVNERIKFAGTLTYPQKGDNFPAVILITGSGPQNRNEELLGHKPFLVLADYLTRNGIAVLRYDDRGIAESEGDFDSCTTKDFASDALSAFEYLKTRKEVDSTKIGLLGHSEGGTIAFMLASQNKDIAYVVSLAGTSYKGEDILYDQRKMISKAAGVDSIAFNENEILIKKMNNFVMGKKYEDIKQNASLYIDSLFPFKVSTKDNKVYAEQLVLLASLWMQYMLQYDPRTDISKIKCPILALNGAKDLQVNADKNLDIIKKLSLNAKVKKYPSLNHLFQHCNTGLMIEYGQIEETISPQVLQDILSWIKEITK